LIDSPRIRHLPLWIVGYIAFIVIVSFVSYYPDAKPPPASLLNKATYIPDSSTTPNGLDISQSTTVTLPDMGASTHKETDGWYIIPVIQDMNTFNTSRLSIYLPVVSQNAEVFLNDRWLGNGGNMSVPLDRNYNRPLIFNFHKNDLTDKENFFYIHVKGLLPKRTYLGEVYVWDESELYSIYEKRKFFRVNLNVFISITLVFTSLFTAVLWLLRRRSDETYYLWYSLAEMLWAVHDTKLFIKTIPVSDAAWESIVTLAIGWSILCFILFLHRYSGNYNQTIDKAIRWSGLAFSLPFLYQSFDWVVFYGYHIWIIYVLFVGIYAGIFLLRRYINTKNENLLLMLLVGLVLIVFGLHDLFVTLTVLSPDSPRIMPMSALLIIVVISSLLIRRLVQSLEVVESFNESLQKQVLIKERQLREEYQKNQRLQKKQILSDERERIMRDIHDGIGGQLVSILAAIESPDATMSQVKENLTIALQDLRMVIDSLDGEAQELTVILGTLRVRLERLLEQANIKLIWQVQDLPMLEEFGPEKALNTMRIVQEAITNVIKHSGASELVISAYPEMIEGKQVAVVSIADNGSGKFESKSTGRGVSNMRNRADQIGASFTTSSIIGSGIVIKLVFT